MRNRYFDLLRAVALVRVVAYHSLGLAWLTVVYPAMGVMFALAGSLMAASLSRSDSGVLRRRLRRLLPPVWLLGAVLVPVMLLSGVRPSWSMAWWLLPLRDPPFGTWTAAMIGMIWYIRAYLWFVLLSPLLLRAYRRFPLVTLAAPFAALVAFVLIGNVPSAAWDFALYGTAWVLGFAHHDGHLHRLSTRTFVLVTGALAVTGGGWILTHAGDRGYDLNDIPIGNALWSAAVILVLFRLAPRLEALLVWPPLNRFASVLTGRAMTIYLWHQTAIFLVAHAAWDPGTALRLAAIATGVFVAMLAFGWVEDLAARRRPALLPPKPARTAAPARPFRLTPALSRSPSP